MTRPNLEIKNGEYLVKDTEADIIRFDNEPDAWRFLNGELLRYAEKLEDKNWRMKKRIEMLEKREGSK